MDHEAFIRALDRNNSYALEILKATQASFYSDEKDLDVEQLIGAAAEFLILNDHMFGNM